MTNPATTDIVWKVIENELFAILGMVTRNRESRTVGIVYIVNDRKFYIGTGLETWKVRHLKENPNVSLTITIAKRVPVMPWIKIPQATITFAGKAVISTGQDAPIDLLQSVFRHLADDQEFMKDNCLIEITPVGEFITYGVGIPLMQMRDPERSRGRASVK